MKEVSTYSFPTKSKITAEAAIAIAEKWSLPISDVIPFARSDRWGITCKGPLGLSTHRNYTRFASSLIGEDPDDYTSVAALHLNHRPNNNEDKMQEEITTDPKTGGQKGKKPLEVGAIDPLARAELGKVAAFGGEKYSRGNYLRGYDWSLSVDALHRHMLAFESGEDYDPESGLLHTVHAAWHALALASFYLHELGNDDRFSSKN